MKREDKRVHLGNMRRTAKAGNMTSHPATSAPDNGIAALIYLTWSIISGRCTAEARTLLGQVDQGLLLHSGLYKRVSVFLFLLSLKHLGSNHAKQIAEASEMHAVSFLPSFSFIPLMLIWGWWSFIFLQHQQTWFFFSPHETTQYNWLFQSELQLEPVRIRDTWPNR